jgi:ADP-ribosylglycohydrolase
VLKHIRRGQAWEAASYSVYRDGSFGNGGAMRAPAIGLFYADDTEDELVNATRASAAVTHAHPMGCEGAVLIALTTALTYNGVSSLEIMERLCQRAESAQFLNRLHRADAWLQWRSNIEPRMVAAELGNGIAAAESCVTAVYVALTFRSRSFDKLLEFVIRQRGDVDTIAAMACAIWGADRGVDALPQARLERLEQCDRLHILARSLAESAGSRQKRRSTR